MDGNSIGPTHSVSVPTRIGDPPRRRGEDPHPERRERRHPEPAPQPAPSAGADEPDLIDDTTPGSLDVFALATNGIDDWRVAERRREHSEATRGWGPVRIHSGRSGGLEQPPANNPDATERPS